MEEWRQRLTRLGKRSDQPQKTHWTPTGLLMEGVYTHPMKKDVKEKDFSLALGEMQAW